MASSWRIDVLVRWATVPIPGTSGTLARPPNVDENARRAQQGVADPDDVRVLEAGMPFDDGQAVHAAQPCFNIRAGIARDGIGPGLDSSHVDLDRTLDRDPVLGAALGEAGRIGAGDQRLGRYAAGIDAGSANQFALDKRDFHADGRQPSGERGACLSGPDDDGVEGLGHDKSPTISTALRIAKASSSKAAGRSLPNTPAKRARAAAPPVESEQAERGGPTHGCGGRHGAQSGDHTDQERQHVNHGCSPRSCSSGLSSPSIQSLTEGLHDSNRCGSSGFTH
jgi:hypothetical protein